MIYFLIDYLIESLSKRKEMSLKALIETYLMFGTGDEQTLIILLTHLSTYFYPIWLNAIYFNE
jgi:hypothetical protein